MLYIYLYLYLCKDRESDGKKRVEIQWHGVIKCDDNNIK